MRYDQQPATQTTFPKFSFLRAVLEGTNQITRFIPVYASCRRRKKKSSLEICKTKWQLTVVVLHMETNVHVGLVENTVVRVSLLTVIKGIMLLNEMGCTRVETIAEPERHKEVEEAAETAELGHENIRRDGEDDVVDLPGRRGLLHGSAADNVHERVDEEPEELQGSVTTDHLLLPLQGEIGIHAGDTLVCVMFKMVTTERSIDWHRDTNVGGQSNQLVQKDGGGGMVVGSLVDQDSVEGCD